MDYCGNAVGVSDVGWSLSCRCGRDGWLYGTDARRYYDGRICKPCGVGIGFCCYVSFEISLCTSIHTLGVLYGCDSVQLDMYAPRIGACVDSGLLCVWYIPHVGYV